MRTASDCPKTGNGVWITNDLRPEFIDSTYSIEMETLDVSALDAPSHIPAGACYWWDYINPPGGFALQARTTR